MINELFLFFFNILLCISCSKKEIEKSIIRKNLDLQVIEAYQEGLKN